MSRTLKDRGPRPHQPGGRWPREIPFSYEPHAVPVTAADIDWQTYADASLDHDHDPISGRQVRRLARGATNRAHVRTLLGQNDPEFAADLAVVVRLTELAAIANGLT